MSNKLVITNIKLNSKDKLFCGLKDEKRFYKVDFFDTANDEAEVGDILVARVKDVVKNINAAFVEYKKGMTGFLSLEENKNIIFLNKKNTDKVCQGDLIIVQVSKAAVKTKFPVLTTNISLTGRKVVLNVGKTGVGFSGKIKDMSFRSEVNEYISGKLLATSNERNENYGVIIRTNAYKSEPSELFGEILFLVEEWNKIKNEAVTRVAFTSLKKAESVYKKYIDGLYENEIQEIVTDDMGIYDEIKQYSSAGYKVSLYNDELLPLFKLYGIESVVEDVKSKKVWLKSGAYLVMEPTEAMYVIDVNTGKCIKGKKTEETIFAVNMEAAKEIAYQLQFRNISGIIMVDFINMENPENQRKLLEVLEEDVRKDKVRTTVVDMTKLNIVEITRKKILPPVYEQIC